MKDGEICLTSSEEYSLRMKSGILLLIREVRECKDIDLEYYILFCLLLKQRDASAVQF